MAEETENNDLYEPIAPTNPRTRVVAGVAVVAIVAVIGAIPAALGFGFFGYRLFGNDVTIHILNVSGTDVVVTASFASPVESAAGSLNTAKSLSGPITIEAVDGSGVVVDSLAYNATTDILYNVAGGTCFAVFDATEFYSGADNPLLRVADRIPAEQRLYDIAAETVVLPRRPPPAEASGMVHWIEDVDCSSLVPENEADLLTWAEYRMLARFERQQDAQQRQQQGP
jgi:hypothetical protein